MKRNVGSLDRAIRIVLGLLFIWWSTSLSGLLSGLTLVIGTILFITGVVGRCLMYKLLKMKTNKCEHCDKGECDCNNIQTNTNNQ